jgi:prevent-host-death family protein
MKTISVSEARTHLSRLLKEIHKTNESIQITRRGKPIARLLPELPLQEPFIGLIAKTKKNRKGAKLDGITIQQLRNECRQSRPCLNYSSDPSSLQGATQ